MSVRAVLGGDLTDPATGGNSKVQKRLTAAFQLARAEELTESLCPTELATLHSGSTSADAHGHRSPSAAAWVTAVPRCRLTTLDDATFGYAVRARLRIPLVAASAACTHVSASAHRACGVPLTPGVDHAHSCARGARTHRHNRLRDWWQVRLREAGALADREQVVYELGPVRADRSKQVVADVRASGGPTPARRTTMS